MALAMEQVLVMVTALRSVTGTAAILIMVTVLDQDPDRLLVLALAQ